ncbi:uncharacterized protein J4E84_005098 [Alternaria hordeiaustralica]|uniref:uncharacterized protein n=1 Tax=Alternaria hordeiaustralica TaxID=1187925 RepID=UPI0020C20AE5|nr:uncharacterized protein J4E84_005098 [Alternaria hordeiaustralica]KAI4688169.1 hypothetical protein J4E84_005098 [Alternaria hordeiaustralica]
MSPYNKADHHDEYQYEARKGIQSTRPTKKTKIPKNRPEPTLSEMFGQLAAVNKKLEDWIESTKASSTQAGDANLSTMTMYKRCLAAYGKVWSNIDDLDKPINSEPALEATGRLCMDLITWAKLAGVYLEGKHSLDYTIRASPKLRNQVLKHTLKPLINIEAALKMMTEIAQEKAAPREQPVSGSAHVPTTEDGPLSYQNSQIIRFEQALGYVTYNQGLLVF